MERHGEREQPERHRRLLERRRDEVGDREVGEPHDDRAEYRSPAMAARERGQRRERAEDRDAHDERVERLVGARVRPGGHDRDQRVRAARVGHAEDVVRHPALDAQGVDRDQVPSSVVIERDPEQAEAAVDQERDQRARQRESADHGGFPRRLERQPPAAPDHRQDRDDGEPGQHDRRGRAFAGQADAVRAQDDRQGEPHGGGGPCPLTCPGEPEEAMAERDGPHHDRRQRYDRSAHWRGQTRGWGRRT